MIATNESINFDELLQSPKDMQTVMQSLKYDIY